MCNLVPFLPFDVSNASAYAFLAKKKKKSCTIIIILIIIITTTPVWLLLQLAFTSKPNNEMLCC